MTTLLLLHLLLHHLLLLLQITEDLRLGGVQLLPCWGLWRWR